MRFLRMRRGFGLGEFLITGILYLQVSKADDYRTEEWYGFTEAGQKWLKEKGCEWIKVEAEPGDLLLCKILESD